MKLNLTDDFRALLEQITYHDHEHNTDVILQITEVISHARAEGLSPDEITQLVRSRIGILLQQGTMKPGEQLDLVRELIDELPNALLNA